MPSKCPKCHLEGEQVSDRAVYVPMPPVPGGVQLKSVEVHIIDGPKCLTRQLAAANEARERAEAACAAMTRWFRRHRKTLETFSLDEVLEEDEAEALRVMMDERDDLFKHPDNPGKVIVTMADAALSNYDMESGQERPDGEAEAG